MPCPYLDVSHCWHTSAATVLAPAGHVVVECCTCHSMDVVVEANVQDYPK